MSNWYLESKWGCRKLQRDLVYDHVKSGKRILDVGSGMGRTLRELNKSKKFIVGIDVDKGNVKESVKINKNIRYVIADATCLPFKEKVFDAVVLENVIEHVRDQRALIEEIHSVLEDGGRLVISTHNKPIYRIFMYLAKIRKLEFDRTWFSNPVPDHVAELRPKTARRLFSKFKEVRIDPINPYLKTKNPDLGIELLIEVVK